MIIRNCPSPKTSQRGLQGASCLRQWLEGDGWAMWLVLLHRVTPGSGVVSVPHTVSYRLISTWPAMWRVPKVSKHGDALQNWKAYLTVYRLYIYIYTHVYLYLICRIIYISHISCQYVHNTCSEFIRDSGDDRNVRDGDGCSSTCQVELGYTCSRSDSAHVDVCHGQQPIFTEVGRSFFCL